MIRFIPPRSPYYSVLAPAKGHESYEPTIVHVEFRLPVVDMTPMPLLDVRRFKPVLTDRWVCVYGTAGSPRDRMRHDARMRGEKPLTHPYMRIAEMV